MGKLGKHYAMKKVANVSGGGNPANPIEFNLPHDNFLVAHLFIGLTLDYKDNLVTGNTVPANNLTITNTPDDYKALGHSDDYYDELFESIQIYAGIEKLIDISGETCRDFIKETYKNLNPKEFLYSSSARPHLLDDDRLIKIPWLTLFDTEDLVYLSDYNSGDFKIILQYNAAKTGYNKGVEDKFPYSITQTNVYIAGHEVNKKTADVQKTKDLKWLSLKNYDIELNNKASSHEI